MHVKKILFWVCTKFRFSEKDTQFEKKSTTYFAATEYMSKQVWDFFFFNFVVFLEFLKFKKAQLGCKAFQIAKNMCCSFK